MYNYSRKKRIKKRIFYLTGLGIAVGMIIAIVFLKKYRISYLHDEKVYKDETVYNDSDNQVDESTYVNYENIPDNLRELYEKNEDAREYVLNYYENKNKDFKIDLSDLKNSDEVPLLMQWDERWGYEEYSGDLFGLTGCGPTCLSMAAIYLTGNILYSPRWMMHYSEDNGYSVEGSGTAWALISEGGRQLGLSVKELSLDEEVMIDNLSDTSIIIAVMGPGDFTTTGHFIVIKEYDNGFRINDPNSYKNTNKIWNYEELKWQIRNLWGLS